MKIRNVIILFLPSILLLINNVSAQYCSATAENGEYEFINSVTVGDTTNESNSNLYSDYTNIVVEAYKGEQYSLSVVNDNHDTPDQITCWADWNQDQVFQESEKINLDYNGNPGEESVATGIIAPPADALVGETRLRVMLASEEPSPCLTFMYGEVEDYTLHVKEIVDPPEVDFEADRTKIFAGETIHFTDLSYLNPTSWEWSFNPPNVTFLDGTDAHSENPVVRFEKAGNYNITLTATNSIGSADTTIENYIEVKAFNPPRNVSATTEGTHVTLNWNKPNMPGYFAYEILNNANAYVYPYPERATLFKAEDFDFTYPVTIEKLSAAFYEDYENDPWPDATFKFKVYESEGNTIIFETPAIEASNYGMTEHELAEPITLNEDFYISVTPVDSSGAPYSFSKVVEPGETNSYFKSESEWLQFESSGSGFELITSIYVVGSKKETIQYSYSEKVKTLEKSELEDFSLQGYAIFRNGTKVDEVSDPDSLFYIDEGLSNGSYEYYLRALYGPLNPAGESIPSDTLSITVDNTEPEIKLLKDDKSILMNETFVLDTNVLIGSVADIEFAVYNEGMNKLGIGDFSIDHPDFSLVSAPADTLLGQDSTYFTIRFEPQSDSISLKKANISFNTNDPNENPFEFSINAIAGLDKWTWMVYLLEDGTGLNGAKDINEWEVNGSVDGRVNYLVLYDAQDDEKDGVYYVTKDKDGFDYEISSEKITSPFGVDPEMSDSQTLENFLLWIKDHYPAQHYGLTMWDHGSGIFKGKTTEKGITKDFVGGMKLWEMSDAVQTFKNQTGQGIDVIGFDVCLLGQFETAYQFKDLSDYVIASELTEPGDGWYYSAAFDSLTHNPDIGAETVAKEITNTYVESYSQGGAQGYSATTQAATSTEVMKNEFIPTFNQLSEKLSLYLYDLKPTIENARDNAWAAVNVNGGGEKNPDHRDLGGFIQNLINTLDYPADLIASAEEALNAYNKMIVAEGHTSSLTDGATGVKIWMPKEISTESYFIHYYMNPDLYIDISNTQWDEYLEMFEDPAINQAPFAAFSIPDTDEKGEKFVIENRSLFGPQSFKWTISPGYADFVSGSDSLSESPEIQLNELGDYNVSLRAENSYGSHDTTYQNCIHVIEPDFEAPQNLTATKDSNKVNLNWQASSGTPIFKEGFENINSWPPEGWVIMSNDNLEGTNLDTVAEGSNTWGLCDSTTFTDQNGNPDPQYIHSGTYSAAIGYTAGNSGDPFNWLITPKIELRENETLNFWLWYASDENYYTDFDVMVLHQGEWTSLLHLTQGDGYNLYESPVSLSLSEYSNDTIRIAFVYQYTDGYQLAIDDIEIRNAEKTNRNESYKLGNKPFRELANFEPIEVSREGNKTKATASGYMVYRNGARITEINDLSEVTYTDTLTASGEYEYYVVRKYSNPVGQSEPSNKVSVTIELFTGIDSEFNSGEVSVYPNPSRGQFNVRFERKLNSADIAVYKADGTIVYRTSIASTDSKTFNLQNFDSGIYYMKIQTAKESITKQIIIR